MKKTILLVSTGSANSDAVNDTEASLPHAFIPAFVAEARLGRRTLVLAQTGAPEMTEQAAARAAVPDDASEEAALSSTTGLVVHGWNPLSWAGVRALWQTLENSLGAAADELVILVDPANVPGDIATWLPHDLERMALAFGSALVQLVQLAFARFSSQGGGTLVLVVCEKSLQDTVDGDTVLRTMTLAGAQAFGESLVQSGLPDGCRFAIIRDESASVDLLARHVCRLLDDWPKDSTKLLRFTGRGGLFGRF